MPILTNNLGLPDAFVKSVSNDDYDKGLSDITVTQLISPPRAVALYRQYEDQVTEDVEDRLYLLLGKAVHQILETADKSALSERLYMKIDNWTLGGLTDHIEVDELSDAWKIKDYKCTSIHTINPDFNNGKSYKKEWEQQLNIYAQLFRSNGFDVSSLSIIAFFRDYSKLQRERLGYLKAPVQEIAIPLWSEDKALSFIREKISLHKNFVDKEQKDLPLCTEEERWARATTYAIMKDGVQKARKVLKSKSAAEDYLDKYHTNQKNMYIETRPGKSIKCDDYCSVNTFCTQYQNTKG